MEEVTTVNEAELHGEHAHEPARDVEAKLEEEKTPQECQPPSVERTGSQIQSLNQLLSKQIKSKMAESTSPVSIQPQTLPGLISVSQGQSRF
eukprot:271302-Hanusia_phi.AAC.2